MPLEHLQEKDIELILSWRTPDSVGKVRYSHHEISISEHQECYDRFRNDPSSQWYIYLDNNGAAMGVVYFTDIDLTQATAFWGFYTHPKATSIIGHQIAFDALDLAFDKLSLYKLNNESLANNSGLSHLLKKAGFVQEGRFQEEHNDGNKRIDVVRQALLANQWQQNRKSFRIFIERLDQLGKNDQQKRAILILSDTDSWINSHLLDLVVEWEAQGHRVVWTHSMVDALRRESYESTTSFCFCLSFSQIVTADFRAHFKHTLVVHESDLPRGKGWSPLTWQILEGQCRIPVTLIEAAEHVDSGDIYAHKWLEFEGHELIDELRKAQADATCELCRWFVDQYPQSTEQARAQQGEESYYPRRFPVDSRMISDKSLAEQFDLLRVVDNQRYPAYFEWKGHLYDLAVVKRRS